MLEPSRVVRADKLEERVPERLRRHLADHRGSLGVSDELADITGGDGEARNVAALELAEDGDEDVVGDALHGGGGLVVCDAWL